MPEQELQGNDTFRNINPDVVTIILMLAINPAISVIGIVGNICSILVILNQNYRKCSNILLLGLAISDLTYLIGFNNIPKIMYIIFGKQSFPYSDYSSEILVICYGIFLIIDFASGLVGLTLPMLITTERLITVFLPLHVSDIITPKRTLISISSVFIFWYGNFIYTVFWFTLMDTFDISVNRTVYVIVGSSRYNSDKAAIVFINEVWTYLGLRIPPAFTFVGCIFIAIKIKMAAMKRRHLTGGNWQRSMHRTTKTLLAVCAMYTVTCVVASLHSFLPQYVDYTKAGETASDRGQAIYQLINTVICLNSSCNFIIYIVFNKNFRNGYKALFINDVKNHHKMKKR